MPEQSALFDLDHGVARKDAGQALVATGSERQDYMARAERYLRLEAPDEPFLMEQLYGWIGAPPSPYLMGALTTRLLRGSVIRRTGRRRAMEKTTSNARKTDEYELARWVVEARR